MLIVSTLAFTVCFMVWMMFGVIGIPIKKTLGLNATQFGLLTAAPVLTGSLIRVPLGMWTDKFGGRIVMFTLLLVCVIPIWLIGYATEYWQFLVLGLFVGLAGGSFSVGIHLGLNVWVFTLLLFVLGITWAFGKASVFKYISDEYPDNIGVISGIVGLAGGLGGFVLPIMFGALMDLTGIRSSAFMLMYGVVWVSLIWMYWTEVRTTQVMGAKAVAFRLRG